MTAREQIREGNEPEVLNLIEDIYINHDSQIYSDIIKNEFVNAFLVIEYAVFNAGVTITDWSFTEDIDDSLLEPFEIFSVEELCR